MSVPQPQIRAEIPDHDPRQLHLVIDNPTARNGLTAESAAELGGLIAKASEDPSVRVIVLRGAGDHFCSGADLRSSGGFLKDGPDSVRKRLKDGFHIASRALFACPKPTLAVIRGACVGFGFDFAISADLRLAAEDATFGQVFTKIGLVPDGGSSYSLPRLVGMGKAMELMMFGERFDGREAARLGLVNRAVPGAELDALATDWAARLAVGPPVAYRTAKANLHAAAGGTFDDALVREQEGQVVCALSKDALIGVQAFFLKSKPKFEGK